MNLVWKEGTKSSLAEGKLSVFKCKRDLQVYFAATLPNASFDQGSESEYNKCAHGAYVACFQLLISSPSFASISGSHWLVSFS